MPRTSIPDKLPGTVLPQFVRCGKANCRCARGELHGPYWYHFWRDDGLRLRKEYVRASDVQAVQAACMRWRAELREGRDVVRQSEMALHWLYEDERSEITPDVIDQVLATPIALQALYEYAEGRKGDFRLRLRAMRALLGVAARRTRSAQPDSSHLLGRK